MDTVSVSDVWTCSGKLFHAAGPATERARFPTCSRVRGTSNSPRAEDHREAQDSTLKRKKNKHLSEVAWSQSMKSLIDKQTYFERIAESYTIQS